MRLFSDVASEVADPYLRHAASLAMRAAGATAPNPLVGCVVVRDGRIVGEGFHPRAGEPHAEVFALADAGADARGADVYVTLEPCRHHGRTPPCTDALIAAGVKRVVIGMPDPSAQAGGGVDALRAAGIEVSFAENPTPFAEINAGWLKRQASGLPFVTVKAGWSLDARPALASGERASMTGASGADITRRLRRSVDAVLVGASTVRADDPALTVRDASGTLAEHQPLRVVLVRDTFPHADARVFTDDAAPTLLLVPHDADPTELAAFEADVVVERYTRDEGLLGVLRVLGARGVSEVLVEAGPKLLTSLWEARLADRWVVVTAGGMAGASAPLGFLGEGDRDGEALVRRVEPLEAGVVGDVCVSVWRPVDAGLDG